MSEDVAPQLTARLRTTVILVLLLGCLAGGATLARAQGEGPRVGPAQARDLAEAVRKAGSGGWACDSRSAVWLLLADSGRFVHSSIVALQPASRQVQLRPWTPRGSRDLAFGLLADSGFWVSRIGSQELLFYNAAGALRDRLLFRELDTQGMPIRRVVGVMRDGSLVGATGISGNDLRAASAAYYRAFRVREAEGALFVDTLVEIEASNLVMVVDSGRLLLNQPEGQWPLFALSSSGEWLAIARALDAPASGLNTVTVELRRWRAGSGVPETRVVDVPARVIGVED